MVVAQNVVHNPYIHLTFKVCRVWVCSSVIDFNLCIQNFLVLSLRLSVSTRKLSSTNSLKLRGGWVTHKQATVPSQQLRTSLFFGLGKAPPRSFVVQHTISVVRVLSCIDHSIYLSTYLHVVMPVSWSRGSLSPFFEGFGSLDDFKSCGPELSEDLNKWASGFPTNLLTHSPKHFVLRIKF